jgi:Tfp pilus assembly protein PilO
MADECFVAALISSIVVGLGGASYIMSKISQTGDSVATGEELQREYRNFTKFETIKTKE